MFYSSYTVTDSPFTVPKATTYVLVFVLVVVVVLVHLLSSFDCDPSVFSFFFFCFTLISLSMYIYIQLVLWSIAKSYHAFSRLVFQVPFLCTSWFWPCFNFEYGLSLFDTYCYSGIPPNKAHTKFMCIQYFTEIYQWLHFFKGGTVV